MPSLQPKESTTVVTAIEAGVLEQQVVLLAESFRRFGGPWRDVALVAVRPRVGPPLARRTQTALRALGVEIIERNLAHEHSWWAHFNKAVALDFVERQVDTPFVTWLDSDVVVLAEPHGLLPSTTARFIARPASAGDVASRGNDGSAPFWHRLCERFNLSFDAFPEVLSVPDRQPIKAYFHGGCFSYRRDTSLGGMHKKVFTGVLDAGLMSKSAGLYHSDQVALAIAVQVLGLDFEILDPRLNLDLPEGAQQFPDPAPVEEARILHYHGAFWSFNIESFRQQLDRLSPEQRALLDRHVPWRKLGAGTRVAKMVLERRRSRIRQQVELTAEEL